MSSGAVSQAQKGKTSNVWKRAISMIDNCRIKNELRNNFLNHEKLLIFNHAVMAYKIINKLLNKFQQRSQYSSCNTRFCKNSSDPKVSWKCQKGFSYSALKAWNKNPINIRELFILHRFKKQLKNHLKWAEKSTLAQLHGTSTTVAILLANFICYINYLFIKTTVSSWRDFVDKWNEMKNMKCL